ASNFERYLFHLFGNSPQRVQEAFVELKESGRISCDDAEMAQVRKDFCSASVNQEETLATIRDFHAKTGYLLDPHTAVGVKAALEMLPENSSRICLATAHPAKFGETVEKALGVPAPVPESVRALEGKPTRCEIMDADLEQVRAFFVAQVG
ncbi:MAG: threonine synthase, partial [Deltaproteobacteria bacterium]|nr:threonine synthase [Deltaproteobacteria bacterium]